MAPITVLLLLSLVMLVRGAVKPGSVVDMTYPFDDKTIYWPTANPYKMTITFRNRTEKGYWYESNDMSAAEHGGTHIDAPTHFYKGKWRVDDIPPERLIAEGVVIDIKDKAKKSAVAQLMIDDIEAWEMRNGRIPRGSIVFMNSGWQSRWPNMTKYLGTATKDTTLLRFPGLHPNAAKWLVTYRDIVGVGVDTPSLDFGPSKNFTVHTTLFEQNVYGLENVANLDKIPVKGATIYALPMKIADGSGAPCRIYATWNYNIGVGGSSALNSQKTLVWILSLELMFILNKTYYYN